MADPTLAGGNKQDRELQEQILRENGAPSTLETLTAVNTTAAAKNDPSYDVEPPADAKTIAGSDQFGLNAAGTNEQNSRIQELASQGQPTPQMANDTNEMQSNAYTDGNSAEAQKRQYDLVSSGQGGLLADLGIADPTNKNSIEAERKKRENAAALLAAAGSWQAQYAQFQKEFKELKLDTEQVSSEIAGISEVAQEHLKALNEKVDELTQTRDKQQKELEELKRQEKEASSPAEKAELEQKIILKQTELENTTASLKFASGARGNLDSQITTAINSEAEMRKSVQDLEAQLAQAGDDPSKQKEIEEQLAQAKDSLSKASQQIEALHKRVEVAANAVKITEVAHSATSAEEFVCLSPEGRDMEIAKITASTRVINALSEASQANSESQERLSADEIHKIVKLAQDANIDINELDTLTRQAADAGLLVGKDGQTALTADEASALLLNEWKYLQGEIAETESKRDAAQKTIGLVDFEQANLQARVATLDNQVAQLKGETLKLEQQTAELEREAASVNTVLGENATEFTYMFKNFSLTNGFFGGESMAEAGNDAARYLRDSGGNPVYVNPNDQTLFTLKKETDANGNIVKDENGNPKIARDADGKQIMVPIAPLEELKLRNDLYEGKLIFANNVTAGLATSVVGESSEEYGAGWVMMHSLANKSDTVKERLQGALDAEVAKKAAMDQQIEQNKQLIAAQNKAIQAKEAEAMIAKSELASHKETLAQLQAKKSILLNEASARGVDLPQDKTDSSKDSKGEATTNLTLATPKYTLEEAAVVKSKLDNIVSITPEGIETLVADAAKVGISKETVEDTLKANKVEIKDNQYANAPSSAPTNTPAPSNLAYFPLIGKSAEVAPIQVAPFKQDPNGIYAAANMSSFADSDAFTKYNAPNSNPTYMEPINNKAEAAPVAKENFFAALNAKDPVAQAAEAARIRMEQEAALRQQQELLAAARSATNSNVGMSGGGTQGA